MKINYWKLLLFILFTITQSDGQHYNIPEPYLQEKAIVRSKTILLSKEQIARANEDLIPYFYSNSDDFEALLDQEKDSNGVMLHENKYKPTFIFQSGMNAYRYYKKYGDQTARKYFINQAEWLRTNFHVFKEYGLWLFRHPKPSYFLERDWPSGLSQGMGIGLALMAYDETGNDEFLTILDKALKAYLIPIEYGGFLRYWDQEIWFEEYPTKNPSRVLNGFLFSMAGLYNLYENTGNKLALRLFNEGVKTLEGKIHLYDLDFISKYSLFQKDNYSGIAKQSYHKLHIWQLLWLYDITKIPVFFDSAKKFLEIQKTKFEFENFKMYRVNNISANNSIGKNGPENVYDNKWSWGGIWASFENPEITFELYEMRELYGFSLYFNGNKSEQLTFEVFIDDEKGNSVKAKNVNKVNQLKFTSNKNRTTSIQVFHFVKVKGKRLCIKFFNASKKNPISLTETNIFFTMDFETEMILKEIQRRRKIDSEY